VQSVLILLEKCLIQFQPDPIAAQDHSISPSEFTRISYHEMHDEMQGNSLGETTDSRHVGAGKT
jgi:hypothetical protein